MFSQWQLAVGSAAILVLGIGIAIAGAQEAEGVGKLAAALEKKDVPTARKLTAELARAELKALMVLFKPREKKGLGVGPQAGMVKPDCIETKLRELSKAPLDESQMAKEADALKHMGYHTAALAVIFAAKAPAADKGNKKRKDWLAFAEELREASIEMTVAAKDKQAGGVNNAAVKMEKACTKCHEIFRE